MEIKNKKSLGLWLFNLGESRIQDIERKKVNFEP